MKNINSNVGSFAKVKLQAKRRGLLATQIRSICVIALVAVIGFSFAACGGDDGGGGGGGSGLVGGIWQETTMPMHTISFTATRFEWKVLDTVLYTGTYEFDPSTGTGILHEETKGLDWPFTLSDGEFSITPYHFRKK
jgi:hypothetical protein